MKGPPAAFLHTMQRLLGDEYPAFFQVYSSPATSGLRANTLKISPLDLANRLPYDLRPVLWCPAGFQIADEPFLAQPPRGRHPYHAAGLYYLQEPSTMAAAELMDPQPGGRVLDLCAAPGGKTTHLAARMDNKGLLVANEIHSKRSWELVENLERWGAHNIVILNESPTRLADRLPGFFDYILVDAPCSGEGMFRKSEAALRDWSPEVVQSCAIRQAAILDQAARMACPGGKLVYSTCTFNPQENEQTVADFLKRHPEFELVPVKHLTGLDPGRSNWVNGDLKQPLEGTARIWPHLTAGEGHFFAILQRSMADSNLLEAQPPPTSLRRIRHATSLWINSHKAFASFSQAYLNPSARSELLDQQITQVGDYLYRITPYTPNLQGLRAIRPGWWLGTIHRGNKGSGYRFEPSHALALGLKASDVRLRLDLQSHSMQTLAYLSGEVLDWAGDDGWVLVCVDGFPLGWGRAVHGRLKNYYPRGLRWV